jgi:cell division septation protein DedD
LVLMVAALATVTTSATAAAAPAKTAAKICVALVVDGRSLGSDVTTSCAKVSKGATGVDVLEAGGHTVGFRSDGLLCTIDGLPKGGCKTVTDTHYWAYFHRAPGSTKWVYSTEGASSYEPANDSTEGWVYDNGTAVTPENVPYAQICKPKASPSPTPRSSGTPTSHQTAAAPTKTPSPPTTTPTAHPSPTASHRHRSSRSPKTSATQVATSPSPSSGALVGAVAPASNHHSWLGLLIGLVVVAALGVAAAIRFRRSAR